MPRHAKRDPNSAAAAATRLWRERRARKLRVVPVEIFEHEVRALVRLGYLSRSQMDDRDRVGAAIARLLEVVSR